MALLCLALLVGTPAMVGLLIAHQLSGQIERLPGVFDGLTGRPLKLATGGSSEAVDILVLGTDRRSAVPTTGSGAQAASWVYGAQRSDTTMLVHIDADRRGVSVVSLPRDSWVEIPGHGMGKLNAAYSWGGPSLAVATVEQLTGIHVDHVAVVDWAGFQAVTDALGGVDVTVPETVHDSARNVTWTAGLHHLTGQGALDYVGERYGLPEGDIDRTKRQQVFFRGLAQAVLTAKVARNPGTLYHLLDVFTENLAVDDDWSVKDMASLALSLRHLRSSDVRYLTAPVAGLGREAGQSVVHLAAGRSDALWQAIRTDDLGTWAATHVDALTGDVVN